MRRSAGFPVAKLLFLLGLFVVGSLLSSVVPSGARAQLMVLPGKFDVSSEGSASFSIPISVPPGTAGMVPSLSINYGSGGGNGPLGVGWGLGGLSSITRCPQTVAQDGRNIGVTYATTDRFCLDGQRLVLTSGTYGAAGSIYHTEIEGFSQITAEGTSGAGPTYFIVQTKSGQTMEYGNTTNSANSAVMLASVPTTVASWLLDKVTDAANNYMVVKYLANPSDITGNTEYVPSEIDYTGNSGGTGTGTTASYPAVTPYNKVTFVYGPRQDVEPSYVDGSLVELTQRLTDIETWSGTQAAPGSTEVSDYKFGYQASLASARSLLASVQLCDAAGDNCSTTSPVQTCASATTPCIPMRTFSYQSPVGGSGVQNNMTMVAQTSNIGNYTTNIQQWKLITGDFVGNGRTDFALIYGTTLNVYLSNGNGTFTMSQQTNIGNYTANIGEWDLIQGDFIGNGKTDFALMYGSTLNVYLSNGDGTFTMSQQTANIGNYTTNISQWDLIQGNFTGNGRSDFALMYGSTLNVYLSNGDGTFTMSQQTANIGDYTTNIGEWDLIQGDFNGDGHSDFALMYGSTLNVYLSKGDGTFTMSQQTANIGNYTTNIKQWDLIQGDFSGGGLADFALFYGSTLNTYLNNNQDPDLLTSLSNGLGATTTINYGTLSQGFSGTNNPTPQSTYSTSWSNYYGGWNSPVCSYFPASYPVVNIAPAIPVVVATQSSNGIASIAGGLTSSNSYSTSYAYACAHVDVSGRGSLGFGQQIVSDPQTNITQTTNFWQNFPDTGLVASQIKTYTGGGENVTLDTTSNTYSTLTPTSTPTALPWNGSTSAEVAPQFPYLSQSVVSGNDLNGAALPTATTAYTYDPYGEATQVSVSKTFGSSTATQTTVNLFGADNTTGSNWILGRLTRSTVTSTSP